MENDICGRCLDGVGVIFTLPPTGVSGIGETSREGPGCTDFRGGSKNFVWRRGCRQGWWRARVAPSVKLEK